MVHACHLDKLDVLRVLRFRVVFFVQELTVFNAYNGIFLPVDKHDFTFNRLNLAYVSVNVFLIRVFDALVIFYPVDHRS